MSAVNIIPFTTLGALLDLLESGVGFQMDIPREYADRACALIPNGRTYTYGGTGLKEWVVLQMYRRPTKEGLAACQ